MSNHELITAKSARLKAKLNQGQVVFGAVLTLADPACAEIIAPIGFDFVFIDTEHSVLDEHILHGLLMGFSGTQTVPIVRVVYNHPAQIKRVLDLGAGGIIVPMINNAAEARAAVTACKYPPQGIRGSGPRRASDYGRRKPEYWRAANESLITILIIEHIEAVRNIRQILEVEAIDAIFIGAGDLCASMGRLGQPQHPDVLKAIDRVLAACKEVGIPTMTGLPGDTRQADRLRQQGVQLIVTGTDTDLLHQATARALNQAKEMMREGAESPNK